MMVAAFILINGAILTAWTTVLALRRPGSLSTMLVYVGVLASAQIVLTELGLGLVALLEPSFLVGANLLCAVGLLLSAWVQHRGAVGAVWRAVGRRSAVWLRAAMAWENALLVVLAAFVSLWMITAAVLLPPRGIDDLVYHLPPIYQDAQAHRLELLPVTLRDTFAFPFNGEFLFLWPLVFFHDDRFVDLGQFVVALFGVLVVYALARRFDASVRLATFVGLLFLFIPVVLGQSGSDYVDVIACVFHLALLVAAVRFYQTGALGDLAMAGIATGFLAGVKDSMPIFIAALQPILWLRFFRDGTVATGARRYAVYWLLGLPLSLYWPLRNLLRFGNPLYPMRVTLTGFQLAPESTLGRMMRPDLSAMWADFLRHPEKSLLFPFQDPGLGSFHGGFGVVVWGMAAPAAAVCMLQALRAALRGQGWFPLAFWGQIVVGGLAQLLNPSEAVQFTARYVVFTAAMGLVALAVVLPSMVDRLPGFGSIARAVCVAAAGLAVIQLADYRWPSFQIAPAVADWRSDRYTSEYTYLQQAPWDLPSLSHAWAPLDYLTRPGPGWSVYMACGYSVFWTAPTFGSRLQNRVWNFGDASADAPDAFIFHTDARGGPLYYVGRTITPQAVAADARYELITHTRDTQLWAKQELLEQPAVAARLADYYRKTYGPTLEAARSVQPLLAPDGVVITASPLGYGLRVLSLSGQLAVPVHLVPDNGEAALAARIGARKVYTVGEAMPGFASRPLARLAAGRASVTIYENTQP